MKTALFLMACAAVCVGVALGDIVSTNTRAATEMWVSRRFASTNDLAEAVAPLVSTQQLAQALAGLPVPSADALRLVGEGQYIDGDGGVWRVDTVSATSLVRYVWGFTNVAAYGSAIPYTKFNQLPFMLPDWSLADRWTLHIDEDGIGSDYWALALYYDDGAGSTGSWSPAYGWQGWPAILYPDLSGNVEGLVTVSPVWTIASSVVTTRVDVVATTSHVRTVVETYLMASNAWIEVDFSNRLVSVSVVVGGSTNTVVAGAAGNSIDPAATNLLWLALADAIATRAPKAWGTYAPDGTPNPEPEYGTFMNAPATVFASGSAWGTYGTYAVLTTPGATAYATGQDGAFRIGPDSTNWFGYVTGGSVLVGAVPESLAVFGGGTEGGYAEIVYQYDGGAFPTLWFTASLALDFTVVATAAWTDNMDGTATVSAPATSASGYWRATSAATFGHVFATSMPARFHAGVFGATNATPVVYDSTILITSGGKTYRIPAQLVE